MAFDQTVNYRVNLDDSNFQAKLTQMRASLDSTVGGGGGGSFGNTMAFLGPMGGGGNFGGSARMSGMSDFGASVQPVSFTPPAIAMQPHFGMFQIQQSLSQAGLAAGFGPAGIGVSQLMTQGFGGNRDVIPPNMSYQEYAQYSTRSFGNSVGATAAAATGAAVSLGLNLAGGAAGSAVGGFLGGGVGAFVGGLAGGMAVGAVGSAIAERAAANIGMQSTLEAGSFRFYQGPGQDSVTGRGFNRSTRANIANSISDMESKDTRFNMDDYGKILDGGMQMDLFSGTKDAEDFKGKFKSLVETVKTVSSTLHTSLKEGLETIRGLRDMGVTDAGTQQSMVMRSEVLGRMSGRTGSEMMAVGQTGAEMFRGTGISMQKGFELNQQNTTLVRSMLNGGTLSRETIAQAGGELSLGQQMTANALGSFQTMEGRGFMMSAFNPGSMSLDPNMINKIAGGDVISGMANAANVMSDPGNLIKFQANQHKMISELNPMQMQTFSIAQTAASANTMMRNGLAGNASFEDTYRAMGLKSGKSQEIVDAEMAMLKSDPKDMQRNKDMQMQQMGQQQNVEAERNGLYGYKLITNAFTRAITNPASQAITGTYNSVAGGAENLLMDIRNSVTGQVDTRVTNAEKYGAASEIIKSRATDRLKKLRQENPSLSGKELEDAASKILQEETGGTKLTEISDTLGQMATGNGVVGKIKSSLTGKEDIGSTVDGPDGTKVRVFGSKSEADDYAKSNNVNVTGIGSKGGRYYGITDTDLKDGLEARQKMYVSGKELEEYKTKNKTMTTDEIMKVSEMGEGISGIVSKITGGKQTNLSSLDHKQMIRATAMAKDMGLSKELEDASSTKTQGEVLRTGVLASQDERKASGKQYMGAAEAVGEKFFGKSDLATILQTDSNLAPAEAALRAYKNGNAAGALGLFQKLTGGDAAKAKGILEDLDVAKSRDSGAVDKILDPLTKNVQGNYRTGSQSDSVSGTGAGSAGGYAGALGPEQMQAMVQLSSTLEASMRTLIALKEQMDASMNKGK